MSKCTVSNLNVSIWCSVPNCSFKLTHICRPLASLCLFSHSFLKERGNIIELNQRSIVKIPITTSHTKSFLSHSSFLSLVHTCSKAPSPSPTSHWTHITVFTLPRPPSPLILWLLWFEAILISLLMSLLDSFSQWNVEAVSEPLFPLRWGWCPSHCRAALNSSSAQTSVDSGVDPVWCWLFKERETLMETLSVNILGQTDTETLILHLSFF